MNIKRVLSSTGTKIALSVGIGLTVMGVAPAKAELVDLCGWDESTYLVAETENFWVSICGGDYPYTYVGQSKVDYSSVRVPLYDYADDGSWFDADNGGYIYSINFNTPQGHYLSVIDPYDNQLVYEYLWDWD